MRKGGIKESQVSNKEMRDTEKEERYARKGGKEGTTKEEKKTDKRREEMG